MSEDNNKNNNDTADDTATLKERLERVENEKAALEMKLKKSDDDLYSEDYLEFLQEQKKKQQPQNNFMSGSRLVDYSEDEITGMPIPKLVNLIKAEVYSQLKDESQRDMGKREMQEQKKKVATAREEIKSFASTHPDFKNYVAEISKLADDNPNLKIEQLYILAGGSSSKPTQEQKKPPPDTRPQNEGGMKQSDKNLSLREVIAREYQKIK